MGGHRGSYCPTTGYAISLPPGSSCRICTPRNFFSRQKCCAASTLANVRAPALSATHSRVQPYSNPVSICSITVRPSGILNCHHLAPTALNAPVLHHSAIRRRNERQSSQPSHELLKVVEKQWLHQKRIRSGAIRFVDGVN